MLKPLTLMARVLTIFSITIVQAQTTTNSSMLCYLSTDNTSHKMDVSLAQAKPYTITCSYSEKDAAIPKFIQFNCEGNATLLTVDVHITNGTSTQKISKDIQVNSDKSVYEIPVLAYVNNDIVQNGKARISSIVFSNNMNTEVQLAGVNFSNSSNNYEVKMNQVFTVDLNSAVLKNHFIKVDALKDVSINIYKSNGEFSQKFTRNLNPGENYLQFEQLPLQQAKYVVVITENIPNSKKSLNPKITVMY
jgi:hypothetical protein